MQRLKLPFIWFVVYLCYIPPWQGLIDISWEQSDYERLQAVDDVCFFNHEEWLIMNTID